MICSTRRAAVRMPLSALLSYEATNYNTKDFILRSNRFGPHAVLVWPFFRPITQEVLSESISEGILDLRRVAAPPFKWLQTLPLPSVVDLGIVLDVLHSELPSLPPIQHVYLERDLLDDTPCVAHNGDLLTVVGPCTPGSSVPRVPVPVIDVSIDLLERRPGFRNWYNIFQETDIKGQPSTGLFQSSSSSLVSEDHTDASASFHSDSVQDQDVEFQTIPLGEVLPAPTTTSTSEAPFHDPAEHLPDPPVVLGPSGYFWPLPICLLGVSVSATTPICM